jgi:hypothetical protein
MVKRFLEFVLFNVVICGSSAQDFCAVTVEVEGIHGQLVNRVDVALEDSSGKVVEKQVALGGVARFCDFDFGRHSVVVDPGRCGERRIDNVEILLGIEQLIPVITQPCPLQDIQMSGCEAWLRIMNDSGRPLTGARVRPTSSDEQWEGTADRFGRLAVGVPIRTSKTFQVAAPGYGYLELELNCPTLDIIRRRVILHPASP